MANSHEEPRTEATATRRGVLEAAGAGTAMDALATMVSTGAAASDVDPTSTGPNDDIFDVERTSEGVFPQSEASGGPTPAGAIVWTPIAEAAYEAEVRIEEPNGGGPTDVSSVPSEATESDVSSFLPREVRND